jgi:hypothetical protein
MKFKWATFIFLGTLSTASFGSAQECRAQWQCEAEASCEGEECDEVADNGEQRRRYDDEYFRGPRFYDKGYDKGYQEPVPAPDWPGANDILMEKLSR